MEAVLMRGDCMEELDHVLAESVDVIVTDPPYSSGGTFARDRALDSRDKYTDTGYRGAARFPSFVGDSMDQLSFSASLRSVLFRGREKLVPGGIAAVFSDWRQLPAVASALQAAGLVWRGIVVWDKGTSRPTPDRWRNDCEYVVWGTNGARPAKMVRGCRSLPGCIHCPGVSSRHRHHQTEKPVALMEQLLQIAPEGGTVLDMYMGSGSTGVAAMRLGLDFLGIELDPGYHQTASRRIHEARDLALAARS